MLTTVSLLPSPLNPVLNTWLNNIQTTVKGCNVVSSLGFNTLCPFCVWDVTINLTDSIGNCLHVH